jgi:hypothetical protein
LPTCRRSVPLCFFAVGQIAFDREVEALPEPGRANGPILMRFYLEAIPFRTFIASESMYELERSA